MSLALVFLGSLARRRLATLFSALAIVLGVALGMAVQVVHEAALSEFGRGLRTVAGAADLQVVGPRAGFAENLYAVLAARPEVAAASPLVEVEVRLPGRAESLQLLGIDVLAVATVSPALLPGTAPGSGRFAALAGDGLFLAAAARAALGLPAGARLTLLAGGEALTLPVVGDLPGANDNRRLAVMDIAAVQQRFGRLGRLTRIDLRLAEGVSPAAAQAALQPLLPPGVLLETPQAAVDEAANLSRAYRVNLTLLAAMALLTGGFLVFSAQALSVVRRRSEFAFLRAIGLERRRLFRWLLAEGALIGLVGGVLGAALGLALAAGLLSWLGGDLGAGYFAGLRPQLQIRAEAVAAYIGLGVVAGLAGAWLPAREAAAAAPAQALKAGDGAALPGGRGHPWLAGGLLLAALTACRLPPVSGLPLGGYLAIALLLAGSVLLLPAVAAVAGRALQGLRPVPGRLAAARLLAAPGHAVVAAAGVLTSVALAAAMAIMVASFRDSVDQWLTQVLPADLYLRTGRAGGGHIAPQQQARIAAVPGVAHVAFTRHDSLRLAPGEAPVVVLARPVTAAGAELPLVGPSRPPAGDVPAIWISEALRDHQGWQAGQRVVLPLGGRALTVQVAGVWRDYARQTGAILLDLDVYRRFTGEQVVNDAAIFLAPTADPRRVAAALLATDLAGGLEVAYPGEIRAFSLAIFDRTFAVTYLLEAAAVLIGLAGVAASFAALAAARRREFGMLRHLGLTRGQIAAMLAGEGALAAAVGVAGGLLAGGAIGLVLIEVVNRQSFHWSMDLHVPWASLAVFAAALIALAALAAVLAGRQAMRSAAVLAVREDW